MNQEKFIKHHKHIVDTLEALCDYAKQNKEDVDPRLMAILHSVVGTLHGGDENIGVFTDYVIEAVKKNLETMRGAGNGTEN